MVEGNAESEAALTAFFLGESVAVAAGPLALAGPLAGVLGGVAALAGGGGSSASASASEPSSAIQTAADGTADNNASDPTQADYAAIGVTGVDDAEEEALLGDVIDAANGVDVNTQAKVQALADAVQSVMTVSYTHLRAHET